MNSKQRIFLGFLLIMIVLLLAVVTVGNENVSAENETINARYKGGYHEPNDALNVAVAGDYAYVADWRGLIILDVSDKTDPKMVGNCTAADRAKGVAVAGDYAYVAADDNGLVIVDVSDKTDPVVVGNYDTSEAQDVAVAGDYAYVADFYNCLVIVDVGDKTDPQYAGGYDPNDGFTFDVAVVGDYAYVTNGNGLLIVDITDKTDPQEAGRYDTTGWAQGVAVAGNYADVADEQEDGLVILDVTDKTDPEEVGHYNTANSAKDIVVVGDLAYVADWKNGLVIVDVSDKTDPREVGHCDTDDDAGGVAVAGDYAYVADDDNGLVIVELAPIAHIDSISPTSAAGGEKISFSGHGTDDGTIRAYQWKSSIDGIFATEADPSVSDLPRGNHSISFRVQDSYGVWSDWTEWDGQLEVSENQQPVVSISAITPNPALTTDTVSFNCTAEDDGTVERYIWTANIDHELHNSTTGNFSSSELSAGIHIIVLKVQDNDGAWSDEVNISLIIHTRPTAAITSISPNPAEEKESITFTGSGEDDGSIIRYVWISSIDDELYNDTEAGFQYSKLSVGTHTIYLKVQDDHGVWSDEVSTELEIRKGEGGGNGGGDGGDGEDGGGDDDEVGYVPGFECAGLLLVFILVSLLGQAVLKEK